MKAIILSAGQGSRLGHLVDDRPKCLIDFGGRTLLDRQLDTLEANGGGCLAKHGVCPYMRAMQIPGHIDPVPVPRAAVPRKML